MLYAIVAVVILILDQGLKYWTTLHLALDTGVKELIPGVLQLRNYHNPGSSFGFLEDWPGARWLFLAVTVIFAVVVIYALAKKWITGDFGRWMAVCVLAGALGNGIDRALYGYVVDMIEFAFFTFPIFNVADIFVTVGGILFCLYIILHKEPVKAADPKAMKHGPGGSVTTKPAPKRVAWPDNTLREVPEPKRHTRRVPPPDRGAELERIQKPVATRETFAELTRRKPGDDPFAEWTQPRPLQPEPDKQPPAAREPRDVQPEPAQYQTPEDPQTSAHRASAPAPTTEPVRPVPEPEPVSQAQDVDEDMEFSLEDILNEFRDL